MTCHQCALDVRFWCMLMIQSYMFMQKLKPKLLPSSATQWYMYRNGLLAHSWISMLRRQSVCFLAKAKLYLAVNPMSVCLGRSFKQLQFKYLGIILDSTALSFKHQVRKVVQITKYNLANFRYIRNCLTTPVAKLYMNTMIIPHLTYCMTSWT